MTATPTLESYTTVEASTAHITREDASLLESIVEDSERLWGIIVYDRRHGWFIHCGDVATDSDAQERLRTLGFSPAFQNLLLLAGRSGARFLDLDSDASEVDGLPKFEWL